MPKLTEFDHKTALNIAEIKRILNTMPHVSCSPNEPGPLDVSSAISVWAESMGGLMRRSQPYGPGLAMVGVTVDDRGDHRAVRLTAVASTMGDGLAAGWQTRNSFTASMAASRQAPQKKSGVNLANAILRAIRAQER